VVSVLIFPNLSELFSAACQHILQAGEQAIARQGYFSLVLAGGSTPQGVYRLLGQEGGALDWSKVDFFWGDERCVPPDHPDSNYRMAWEALLACLPVPPENLHRIQAESHPVQAAQAYQEQVREYFRQTSRISGLPTSSPTIPSFDLILLGMGEDGHTVSLFPGTPALAESQRWVVAVDHNQPPPPLVDRVTLTLPLINAAQEVVVLVAGENKAACLEQVFAGHSDPPLPVQLIRPTSGELTWMLDQAAGVRLPFQGLESQQY
jgi:6-phosphogluconolactonase